MSVIKTGVFQMTWKNLPGFRRVFTALTWLFVCASCLLLSFFGVVFAFLLHEHFAWNSSIVRESKSRGDVIVGLLEEHHRQQGRFPGSLDELNDGNNNRYQQPTSGLKQWRYLVNSDRSAFELSFSANDNHYPVCYYDSKVKRWYEDR
ncbi:hypothetical protein [Thalassoglobus neptunius]|uniref:hypothetical protein n=1 Tax=Thalassoglobus neptunius TaxID=1938619 RepID=UPI001E4B1C93|nr:hypothetical protein [Thalassoglobus neptunius]